MKKEYRRKAWLLDEDILLEGYVAKKMFYPNRGIQCGFSAQRVNKKHIGVIVYFDENSVKALGLEIVK